MYQEEEGHTATVNTEERHWKTTRGSDVISSSSSFPSSPSSPSSSFHPVSQYEQRHKDLIHIHFLPRTDGRADQIEQEVVYRPGGTSPSSCSPENHKRQRSECDAKNLSGLRWRECEKRKGTNKSRRREEEKKEQGETLHHFGKHHCSHIRIEIRDKDLHIRRFQVVHLQVHSHCRRIRRHEHLTHSFERRGILLAIAFLS